MSGSQFSQNWHKVRNIKPRLRRHVDLHHHLYRGREWYLLQDRVSGRYHRFDTATYQAIGQMNGLRTVEAIWQSLYETLGDDAPTQDEFINLLGTLYQADALVGDVLPDIEQLHETRDKMRKAKIRGYLRSPLAIKLPLLDPDRFLDATHWIARVVYCPAGLVLWLAAVISGLFIAGQHWNALTDNIYDQVFVLKNVVLMMLIYPVVKTVHEFAHAYAVKRWQGEVHEMGIIFLIFMPIPYVDASASHVLANKYKRALIGAAGIFAELLIAAVALHLWVALEPGTARSLAYNTILIAGVSTIFFNGNPLLRFDGYYILADLLEMPNMGTRANKYIGYLCQRYLLKVEQVEPPLADAREKGWLFGYAILAFAYRIFISAVIVLFVAGKFFIIGVIIAIWVGFQVLVMPLYKVAKQVIDKELLMRRKKRATVVAALVLGLLALLFLYPMPVTTVAQGVVWNPATNRIYAPTEGFVTAALVSAGSEVGTGELLLQMDNEERRTELRVLDAQIAEAELRMRQSLSEDRASLGIYAEQLELLRSQQNRLEDELSRLQVTAQSSGRLVLPDEQRLPGRFLRKGEYIGYVIPESVRTVMAVIGQDDIDYIRNNTRAVTVMPTSALQRSIPAEAVRMVPAASRELPGAVLAVEGGGEVVIDPKSEQGMRSLETLYWIEIVASEDLGERTEERIYVRFEHGPVPLSSLLYRKLRQTFIKHFQV